MARKKSFRLLAILIFLGALSLFGIFAVGAQAESTPAVCNYCHTWASNADVYAPNHDTVYNKAQWPDLNPDCRQSGCHEINSTLTGNPNLWKQHLGRSTTSSPSGMSCEGCHHPTMIGTGTKLDSANVQMQINTNNTDCQGCHTTQVDHNIKHDLDTTYIDNPPIDCTSCHSMNSPETGKPNLQVWHINRSTTTYPDGMNCQSCHEYSGTYLSQTAVKDAIISGNKKCDACHSSTIHGFDPNPDHRTNFLGNASDCTVSGCHTPSRTAKDTQPNLQDFHLDKVTTSYPQGMNCQSCHEYGGTKLLKTNIDNAIALGGYSGSPDTSCNSCHTEMTGTGHEIAHNTQYDSTQWPNLSPDCQSCHEAKSTTPDNAGNPNLWQLHLRNMDSTTSFPNGMDCQSCHDYSGTKLIKTNIDAAIATGNKDCKACHTIHSDIEPSHDTNWIADKPVDCSSCHDGTSPNTNNPNLWGVHLGKQTTSFIFMDCQSCHNYTGTYLDATAVKNTIAQNKTNCDSCHTATLHNFDPNTDHRTDFTGNPADCTVSGCHTPSRTAKDTSPNLQDYHLGKQTSSYPVGMNCDSCHSYTGTKLLKTDIDNAIAKGGMSGSTDTQCTACHKSVGTTGHEAKHDTVYNKAQWPDLSPDCTSCHAMASAGTGQPNLWKGHLNKPTTSYPGGMNCQSCHDYTGTKLVKSEISNAINNGNTDCSACHGGLVNAGHENFHDTTYMTDKPVACESCHEMVSANTSQPNLWKWHLSRPTASYPNGMGCQSCHDYAGTKLVKTDIDNAISSNNTLCDSCHANQLHEFDPNTEHRTNFMGNPADCTVSGCHTTSRTALDTSPNLQDYHLGRNTTSYPNGMNCNSCHQYQGTKLNVNDINTAIAQGSYSGTPNTECNACHKQLGTSGHEAQHQTEFDSSQPGAVSLCSKCHITDSSKQAPFTVWDVHLNKKSTTYTAMGCDTCHNYSGTKLSKNAVSAAISSGNKDCKACHETIGNHALTQSSTLSLSAHSGKDCTQCHERSTATVAKPVLPDSSLETVPGSNICFDCHSSTGGAPDLLSLFTKTYRHKTPDCSQCHDPHVADNSSAQAPKASGAQKGVKGVKTDYNSDGSISFTLLSSIVNQYESCFLCHSVNPYNPLGGLPALTKDKASEFNTNNPSYHPVVDTGKNLGIKEVAFTPGSLWNLTTGADGDYSSNSAKVYCTDCHGTDNASVKGPHGSGNKSILNKPVSPPLPGTQEKGDSVVSSNELCFSCHNYNVYVNSNSGSRFNKHGYHVNSKKIPCLTCHTVHGKSNQVHLFGNRVTNVNHTSSGGQCYTSCHSGKNYSHQYPHVSEVTPPPPGDGGGDTGGTVKADQALWIKRLKYYTYSDSNGSKSDITSKMSDGSYGDDYDVDYDSGDHRVIALKANKDANGYSKVVLRFYVTSIDGSPSGRIYAYNSDANSLNTSTYKSYSVSSKGWNEVDVTATASKMNGYGWMKFRLLSTSRDYQVAETEFNLTPK